MQVTLMEGNADQLFDLSEKSAEVLADDGQTIEIAIRTGTGEVLLHLSRREPCEFDIGVLRSELQHRRLERRGETQKFDAEKFTRRLMQLEQEQPA